MGHSAQDGTTMAYDERLAQRVREALSDRADLTEKKMFGGLSFLLADDDPLADWLALGVSFAGSLDPN
jgi:hypothetical protein